MADVAADRPTEPAGGEGAPDDGPPDDGPPSEEAREATETPPARGLLALRLGEHRFGLWVDEVLEIVRTPPISRMPLPRPEIAGLTSVRGELVPVLDLGERLLSEPASRPGRLVLVRHEESGTVVGLLVDGVDTLIGVVEAEVEAPPEGADTGLPPALVRGVLAHPEGVVTILDPVRVAAPPDEQPTEEQERRR